MSKTVRIAITLGDPAGIGPELVAKALSQGKMPDNVEPIVIGGCGVLSLGGHLAGVGDRFMDDIEVITPSGCEPKGYEVGKVQAACGEAAFRALERGIAMALEGSVDAIVTAPLHKQAMHLAGHQYPGHTEILAEKCGNPPFALMLIAGAFRVVHVTCHVAIDEIPGLLSIERVVEVAGLFNSALTRLDGRAPRIAVCALNPHGGEGGIFGREEIEILEPAVQQCQESGISIDGPFPSDSVYPRHCAGEFDGVIAMYHDQGHIAFKLINFHVNRDTGIWEEVCGVNVTLGLPIIRTSVDHGTAFDIAGKGQASERSLLDAIDVAVKLARNKK